MLPVRTQGSGRPQNHGGARIILLHWLGGSGRTWTEVSELAARRGYRLACLDLPGFGDAVDIAGYSVEEMATAVISTIATLRAQDGDPQAPWLLGGHSMGGKVAAVVARRAVDGDAALANLRGVFLVSPSPAGPEPMPGNKRQELLDKLGRANGDAEEDRERAGSFLQENTGKLALLPEIETRSEDDILRLNRRAFSHWLTDGSREDWSDRVGVLPLSVLLLAGSEDGALGPAAQREHTLPHFAAGELVTLEGAGHLAPLERPAEVGYRLLRFAAGLQLLPEDGTAALASEFDALIEGDLTSPQTRLLMEQRLAAERKGTTQGPQCFGPAEMLCLEALGECVVPGAPFDLAQRVDQTLAFGKGDGWRYATLPPDREAWVKGLRSLDHAAHREAEIPFVALHAAQQQELLEQAAAGKLGKGLLGAVGLGDGADSYTAAEMKQWFEEARGAFAKLYISDPRTMQRVGFAGFADEAGFTQIRLGETEEFER